jgi:2-oxo-4-hydroxy-4-carboxy-5-ureidoimidazoline decarboxylase
MADRLTTALTTLNGMSRSGFVDALGDIFEHAPWVADKTAAHRPFATVTTLHDAMLMVLAAESPETVRAFLNGHPDLAGPTAPAQPLTADSKAEQGGAGLDALTSDETARLAQLNAEYRARFGFPFIICVRRHTRDSIFSEFARRLKGEPVSEHRAALAEIARITALRLAARVDGDGVPKVNGELSTHVLDTARGVPAVGVSVELLVLSRDGSARRVAASATGAAGRTPVPLIAGRPIPIGTYEMRFALGAYFNESRDPAAPTFLDVVPVRFVVTEPEAHYHIPLLFTPWSYNTYRGS